MIPKLKVALVAGIVATSLMVAAFARAAEPTEADIRVRVIHARTGEKQFDRNLEDLRKFFKHYPFTSYRQVIDESLHLNVSDTSNTKGIGLLSGKNLNVSLVALTKEKAVIRVLLVGRTGQILDTTVTAGPHKLFFIAGPRYQDGVLFIAIEPHYDPENVDNPNVVDSSKRQDP